MLKTNKPLKAKTPLKVHTLLTRASVKKRRKPTPLLKKTASQLVKEADKWFSRYIRLRDSVLVDGRWVCECIDGCKRKGVVYEDGKWKQGVDAGHFKTRGFHNLRFDEENVNGQSSYCNAWRDKDDMTTEYRKNLDAKYGNGTADKLDKLSKAPDSHKLLTKAEYLEIIRDSKECIDFYLNRT